MIIASTFYNHEGELMAPRAIDLKTIRAFPNVEAGFEAGFYHRHKIEAHGRRELAAARRAFFTRAASTPGYSTLALREYRVGARLGLEIVYAVENPAGAVQAPAQGPWRVHAA